MKRYVARWQAWLGTTKSRRWKVLALVLILVLGIFLRVFLFPTYPNGLNQDELSAAYESYSLATTGKDRWGQPWPAYFLGWGSGQNVLQSYLSLPVVAALGLSPLSVRLVPLLLGIATLPLFFWVVRRYTTTGTALIATLILAVCPWHVLLSRWGLESNILPFFLLLGIATLDYAVRAPARKSWVILFALIPFAVGFYAYGTSAIVIPVLALCLLSLSWRAVVSRWRWWTGAALIAAIVALPFIVFVLKNYVFHQALAIEHILPFSIPTLEESRIDQIRGQATVDGMLSPGDPLYNVLFIGNGFNDHTVYNVVGSFLPLPIGVLLLAIAGCAITLRDAIRRRFTVISPFLIWLIASSGLFFIAALNVNQANAVFLPLIALASIATTRIANLLPRQVWQPTFLSIVVLYILAMGGWAYASYLSPTNARALATNYHPELTRAFAAVTQDNHDNTPIYVTETIALNYVQTLFYTHTTPSVFQSFHSTTTRPDFANYYFSQDRLPAHVPYRYLINKNDDFHCNGTQHITWRQNDWQVGICTPPAK